MALPRAPRPGLSAVLALLALATLLLALAAVATLSWTELYADQWRVHPLHLEQDFPRNVLVYDNGHRQVLPAVLRVLEFRFGIGGMALQYLVGTLAALLALGLVAWAAWREPGLPTRSRWTAIAMAAFALLWLGNARILLSAYESPTDYLLVAFVVAALLLVARPGPRPGAVAGAIALGVLGTFCYGSGIAGLGAVALVLMLQRRWRAALMVAVATVATVAAYLTLPGVGAGRGPIVLAPLDNLLDAATWLASAWLHLFGWLVDPDTGGGLPAALRRASLPLAQAWQQWVGSPFQNNRPLAAVGLAGLALLGWWCWRAWRERERGRLRLLGLGLAAFIAGMGLVVALARVHYFQEHPDQRISNRYLLWSCLFWLGLLLAWLAAPPRSRAALPASADGRDPASAAASIAARPAAAWLVLVVLAAGLATGRGHWIWGTLVQQGIRLDVAGIVSGVVPVGASLGETVFEEVRRGEPVLRRQRINAFGWPESLALGTVPEVGEDQPGVAAELAWTPVENRWAPGPAVRLDLTARRLRDVDMPERLLLLADGVAVAVLVRQRQAPGWRYAGFAAISGDRATTVVALRGDGAAVCWHGCRRQDAPPAAAPDPAAAAGRG